MTITPIKPLELMKGEFTDFIGIWENHVPKFVCDKLIKHIEYCLEEASHNGGDVPDSLKDPSLDEDWGIMKGTTQFRNGNLGRKDFSVMLNYSSSQLCSEMNQYLHACFLDYIREYGQLTATPLISTDSKLQKTMPEGGYHVWHSESSGYEMAQRVLVWMIYLNDLPDGEAETEFLYQHKRIKPKRGTCVIWPAGFTHVHRGNPVYSENKYILTGWYINAPISN